MKNLMIAAILSLLISPAAKAAWSCQAELEDGQLFQATVYETEPKARMLVQDPRQSTSQISYLCGVYKTEMDGDLLMVLSCQGSAMFEDPHTAYLGLSASQQAAVYYHDDETYDLDGLVCEEFENEPGN